MITASQPNCQTASESIKLGPLRLLILQGTSYCNLDCSYCYLPNRSQHNRLDLKLLKQTFINLFSSNLVQDYFTVCWHAGEPLSLSPQYYQQGIEIIENLRQEFCLSHLKITYSVQTNGLLITQAWCDLFKRYPFRIGVSLDGPDFLHNAYRKTKTGLGSHQGTMTGIKRLQNNKIPFQVIAVITEKSLDYAAEIFDFFDKNNINNVAFNVEEVEGINQQSSLIKHQHRQRVKQFFSQFWQLTVASQGKVKVREFEQVSSLILSQRRKFTNQLTHPLSIISIDYQGNFSTFSPELLGMKSQNYQNFILGNVQSDSFSSILENNRFQTMYHEIKTGVSQCRNNCQYFSLCGGGAPSNKYWENGTFASSETMACQYNKQTIIDIVLQDLEQRLGLIEEVNP